ncbi:hypothetical protein BH160DRAFT_1181 [Burkholderia sp. H160]|nr:hypothetical protein BH160DRAFT_1181 [Burkholderia sp. H160]
MGMPGRAAHRKLRDDGKSNVQRLVHRSPSSPVCPRSSTNARKRYRDHRRSRIQNHISAPVEQGGPRRLPVGAFDCSASVAIDVTHSTQLQDWAVVVDIQHIRAGPGQACLRGRLFVTSGGPQNTHGAGLPASQTCANTNPQVSASRAPILRFGATGRVASTSREERQEGCVSSTTACTAALSHSWSTTIEVDSRRCTEVVWNRIGSGVSEKDDSAFQGREGSNERHHRVVSHGRYPMMVAPYSVQRRLFVIVDDKLAGIRGVLH